jgi:formate/nitrite transporter FocA (FNT family)
MSEPAEEREEVQAQERRSPSGRIVHAAILAEGEEELGRPGSALFWSGLAAGLSMGFSLIAQGLLQAHLPAAQWRSLVVRLGYSLGFLCVVLGRQQLYTENTLTAVLPVLHRRSMPALRNMLRLWGIVLVANLLGALLIGWAVTISGTFEPRVQAAFIELGHEAMQHGFWIALWRGIFAGWLIALMVWLLPFAETGRVAVIVIITYIVGLGGFTHIVAGAVEVFSLAASHEKSWLTVLGSYALPTLIGNTIGGVTLVAALNHAQVCAGAEPSGP